jgi:prophage maintenance system killer protein
LKRITAAAASNYSQFWTTIAQNKSVGIRLGYCRIFKFSLSQQEKEHVVSECILENAAFDTKAMDASHRPTTANKLYENTLFSFAFSQSDQLQAMLLSNTSPNDAVTLTVLQVLDLDIKARLSPTLLCSWHGSLCHGEEHAGLICPRPQALDSNQDQTVTWARPPQRVLSELEQLCDALVALETHASQSLSPCVAAMTFAAAVALGIGDMHAFASGNTRLVHLAVQWALKRAGIPFCVTLFETPEELQNYTKAQSMTRRNLYLVSRGDVPHESLLAVFQDSGCFFHWSICFWIVCTRLLFDSIHLCKRMRWHCQSKMMPV